MSDERIKAMKRSWAIQGRIDAHRKIIGELQARIERDQALLEELKSQYEAAGE